MPSFHSVARQQHLKQERKEKMNNQITLKQLLLVAKKWHKVQPKAPFFS